MRSSFGHQAAPLQPKQPWEGVLLVDKPADWTSHDVVAKLRNHFRIKKVGHGGTLDPMATGLLLVLLGRGTRLSDRVMASDKIYEGTIRLGQVTDSHDAEGDVLEEHAWENITEPMLVAAMKKWTGDIRQVPPMVSAIKKDGVALYKMARKGQTIEREPRNLHIYSFKLLSFTPPTANFVVTCSKGTYVRTLCHDIGQDLGCGAHLAALRRTRSGGFSVKNALTLDQLLGMGVADLSGHVIPPELIPQDPIPGQA